MKFDQRERERDLGGPFTLEPIQNMTFDSRQTGVVVGVGEGGSLASKQGVASAI